MARKKSTPARHACEAVPTGQRQYNSEHKVLPSTIPIYDRVLARGAERSKAYEEAYEKLHAHPRALEAFFIEAVEIAAYWTGKKNAAARAASTTLVEANQTICETASVLADLQRQTGSDKRGQVNLQRGQLDTGLRANRTRLSGFCSGCGIAGS